MEKKLFTKSAFKEALACPARLNYYNNDRYANQNLDDEFLKALADGGFQVGELAKVYYGISEENDLSAVTDSDEAVKRTKEILAQESCVIAEAAFKFGDLLVRADIVKKEGPHIDLVEVKAKSWNPSEDKFASRDAKSGRWNILGKYRPYVYDVAFQKYVLCHALKEIFPEQAFDVHAALMMADKSKVADVTGMNQCFGIEKCGNRTHAVRQTTPGGLRAEDLVGHVHVVNPFDVDEICDEIISGRTKEQPDALRGMTFVPFVQEMSRRYCAEERHFCELSTKCFDCPYYATPEAPGEDGFDLCWKTKAGFSDDDLKKPLLEELWGGGDSKLRGKLFAAGKYLLEKISSADLGTVERKAPGLTHVERKILQLAMTTNRPEMLGDLGRNVDEGAYLDVEGLRKEMANWKYPLHMIDFETSAVALPFYKGMHPYEIIAFQFSHHVITKEGDGKYSIRHAGQFLNVEKGKFPNFDFVRELKRELEKDDGSIFRYATHENTTLRGIRSQLERSEEPDREELIAFIDAITEWKDGKKLVAGPRNMIDLLDIVQRYYYHESMKGINSIKAVLPAVLKSSADIRRRYSKRIYGSEIPSLNIPPKDAISLICSKDDGTVENPYKKLPPVGTYFPEGSGKLVEAQERLLEDVKNGGAALAAYGLLQFSEGVASKALEKALLRYCELDTMAMVFIWEYFNDMCKKRDRSESDV